MSFRNDHDATHARAEALSHRLVVEMQRTAELAARLAASERERQRLMHEMARTKDNPVARETISLRRPTPVPEPPPPAPVGPPPAAARRDSDFWSYILGSLVWIAIVGTLYAGFR